MHNKRPVVLSSVGFELIADCQQATSPAIWRSTVSFPHGHRRGWWAVVCRRESRADFESQALSPKVAFHINMYILLIKVLQEQLIVGDPPRVQTYFFS